MSMSRKRRLSSSLNEDSDDRPEEVGVGSFSISSQAAQHSTVTSVFQRGAMMDSGDFGINDDEMLDAVLEMSRQEAGLLGAPLEDESRSSPDTGFGDTDVHDLVYHTEPLDTDNKQPAGKNQTPAVG